MPSFTGKVIFDDGTEFQIGPLQLTAKEAAGVQDTFRDKQAALDAALAEDRLAEAMAESQRRSDEAEASNQARIEAANQGIDPDAGGQ